jgi:hypothetical protein
MIRLESNAEWQSFRAQNASAFFCAKVEVLAAPPCFRVEVLDGFRGQPDAITFEFNWFAGERRRLRYAVSHFMMRESVSPDCLLGAGMRNVARQIEADSGALVRLSIRSDRAAYEAALAAIADKQKYPNRNLPPDSAHSRAAQSNMTTTDNLADISDLNEAAVLAALYNASKPQGMGFLQYTPEPMEEEEAAELLSRYREFDYLRGRVMKIRFFNAKRAESEYNAPGKLSGEWLYDRDNGKGAFARVLASLRAEKAEQAGA